VAALVAEEADADVLETDLVLEGGGIEVDGDGTAIVAESCVLNKNRNPGVSKSACEAELKRLLGLQKILWIPGIKGKDITDGHTDFYARFAGPGTVLVGYDPDPDSYDHAVTKQNRAVLSRATDAAARAALQRVYPGRKVISLNVDGIAAGGGSIHCATQQEPRV
jgi:agmatine deiminase